MATTATTAAPSAGTHRVGNPALVGTLAAVAAGAMAFTGIGVAFLTSRDAAGRDFVPTAVSCAARLL